MIFPHLRAAFSIAVRWEGVALALLPNQILLVHLWIVDGSPPWGALAGPQATILWISPTEWGLVFNAALSGAAAVLLVPLVQDYRGLRIRLLRRRPLAWIAAAAIPYLLPKALKALGLEPLEFAGLAVDLVCTTVLPAWLAVVLLAGDFGARRTCSARAALGSAVLVALSLGLMALALGGVVMLGLVDVLTPVTSDPFAWAFVAARHASGWLAFTAQAWFLRRILAPAPKPAAAVR